MASAHRIPVKIAVTRDEYRKLSAEAARMGLSNTRWLLALLRARLCAKPTLGAPYDVDLAEALTELTRIARALTHISQRQEPGRCMEEVGAMAAEVKAAVGDLQALVRGNLQDLTRGSF